GSLPPEDLVGELVGVVPVELLGDEVIDPRFLVDLRQLPVVSERIGVPADAHVLAEARPKVALADEQLAHDRFAVGHVEIGLDPHAADDLPAALLHPPHRLPRPPLPTAAGSRRTAPGTSPPSMRRPRRTSGCRCNRDTPS